MESTAAEGRHASWLELFFDLVIVAAVAQLAHLLHDEHTLADVALVAILYYAIWSVWTSFTLYANVSGERTRTRAMLIAMFGIAVLAVAVPNVLHGHGAQAFAVAYVLCRFAATASWADLQSFTDVWPAAQFNASVVFWIVSIFVDAPGRYYLWAAGVLLEIVFSALSGWQIDSPRALERRQRSEERRRQRREQVTQRRAEAAARRRGVLARAARSSVSRPVQPPQREPTLVELDQPHLGERLGLFVIIVLGEAVVQVVDAAAESLPDRALWSAGLAGFGLLVSIWWLTLQYGAGAVPHFGTKELPPRITLPAHYLMTAGIVAVAAGLGAVAEHAGGHLPEPMRWIMCGGSALYFLVVTLVGILSGAPRVWLLGWAIPAVVASVLLGAVGGHLPAWSVVAGLLAIAVWQVLFARIAQRHQADLAEQREQTAESP